MKNQKHFISTYISEKKSLKIKRIEDIMFISQFGNQHHY